MQQVMPAIDRTQQQIETAMRDFNYPQGVALLTGGEKLLEDGKYLVFQLNGPCVAIVFDISSTQMDQRQIYGDLYEQVNSRFFQGGVSFRELGGDSLLQQYQQKGIYWKYK